MHRHVIAGKQSGELPANPKASHQTLSLAGGFVPLFIANCAAQAVVLSERILASLLPEGSISQLSFAYRLATIPSVLFGMSILIAIFPTLATRHIQGDRAATNELLTNATSLALAVLVPASVLIYVLADPLVQLIFERGAFNPTATMRTAEAAAAYAIAIPALGLIALATRAVLATGRGGPIVGSAIAGTVTTMLLQLIALRFESVSALALAVTVGAYVQLAWIWRAMTRTCQFRHAWRSPLRWAVSGSATALLVGQKQWAGPIDVILALGACGLVMPATLWMLGERRFNPFEMYRALRTP
jgi:putative peptidoglycan lipid II flippase